MDDDMSCSSRNSITPTAQDKPDQIDGDTWNFVISGSAHQINPIQANQNRGDGFTINNRDEAPGGDTSQKEGSSSKNSSTSEDPRKRKQTHESSSSKTSSTSKEQKKQKTNHGGTTTFEISGCANQINPTQANQNSGKNFAINNSYEAAVDNRIGKKESSSSKNSSISKVQKKPKGNRGGTTTFEISGWANQINPTQANQNSGNNFSINNSCEAAVGNRTGKKESSSSKNSSTSKEQKKPKGNHDETSLIFREKLKLQPMSSSPRSGGAMTSEITGSAHQIDPSQANRNSGKTSRKQGRG